MSATRVRGLVVYLGLGVLFGIILLKSEVVSWFRIYEMFRFQSPRMYLIIGSAVITAGLSLQVIRRLNAHAVDGTEISIPHKVMGRGTRYWLGGIIFGLGWGLIGACPGPLLALIGGGTSVMVAAFLSALLGTATYGMLRPRLPH